MPALAASLSPSTPRCWRSSGAEAHHDPKILPLLVREKAEGRVLLAPSPLVVKGSKLALSQVGFCLLFPPGRAVNRALNHRKPQWAGADPGVIFSCPLPFPRTEQSHRGSPPARPGGLQMWHRGSWGVWKDMLHPELSSQHLGAGWEKAPSAL